MRKRGIDAPGHPGIKKDRALGRVYTVHPNNAECYYLRLLLHEIRGPTSFLDLKVISGETHPTFQSACRALGLLEDGTHWDKTLEESVVADSPTKIRELFAIMLVHCHLSELMRLWTSHKDNMAEDIKRQQQRINNIGSQSSSEHIFNSYLALLQNLILNMAGKTLKVYGLSEPSWFANNVLNSGVSTFHESYDINELSKKIASNEKLLNREQHLGKYIEKC